MGHFVTGIIAKECDANMVAEGIPFKYFHPLRQGFLLFPLTDELIDKHIQAPQNFNLEQFSYCSAELAELLKMASSNTQLAYIETEYFGGVGAQSAAVFENKEVIYGPKQAEVGPINDALQIIGVSKSKGHHDEFESVGLADFRSSEELFEHE
jgi:hypothetical protein